MSDSELAEINTLQGFLADEMAYDDLHSTQPQTLANALADPPTEQLGWSYRLFGPTLDPDFVVTNVAIHWLTRTSASAMRFYWEDRHTPDDAKPEGPTTTPLALAAFPLGLLRHPTLRRTRPRRDRALDRVRTRWPPPRTRSAGPARQRPAGVLRDRPQPMSRPAWA